MVLVFMKLIIRGKRMAEKNFVKGMNLKTVESKYGGFISGGIHKDIFKSNNIEGDWINFNIFTGKNGNPYAVINDYKKAVETHKQEVEKGNDDIPF